MKTIALIGFMGSGKSTIGPMLAGALGRDFVDLDEVVKSEAGMTVDEIFAAEGEEGWRKRESRALQAALSGSVIVLSCGGGVILDPANRALLEGCLTVWLTASIETLLKRVGEGEGRPLLDGPELRTTMERLHRARLQIYAEAADITISTDDKEPAALSEEILSKAGSET